jgi:hypothetical protein
MFELKFFYYDIVNINPLRVKNFKIYSIIYTILIH